MSHVESIINKLVLYVVITQLSFSALMAISTKVWAANSEFDDHHNTDHEFEESTYAVLSFFTYLLLLNTLLPISLQVTLEIVKVVQAYFINLDALMYSWERDKMAKCANASIVEDLG